MMKAHLILMKTNQLIGVKKVSTSLSLRVKSGIMVIRYNGVNFVSERHGYLALTNKEYQDAVKEDPTIYQQARQLLVYGENCEGYWTSPAKSLSITYLHSNWRLL